MTETEIHDILKIVVKRIVEQFAPQKIILFGSYAQGTPSADSDADLLIIMDVLGSKRKQAVEIDLLLQGIPIATDVLVVSPEDVEKYRDCPGNIIRDALRAGRVLYERAA